MEQIILTGSTLTAEQFYRVVFEKAKVSISAQAQQRLIGSRHLLFDLTYSNTPIYGLNTGVGWNKDEAVPASHCAEYNRKLILSHCTGLPPYAREEDVRAALLTRLNILLLGATGISPEIPAFYADLLNHQIHPLIPEQGSVGQADLALMSFVGLTILGEGQVHYKGEIAEAKLALEKEGLTPLDALGARDGLAIVSTNGLSLGQGMLVLKELEDLLQTADLIFCCALEALNGNVCPFDEAVLQLKGDVGILETGATLRKYLAGSFLYKSDAKRHLQDPLCFRNIVHIHGAVREMLDYTKERVRRALNTGEDNPSLLLDEKRISPTANFEPLNWVLGMESLAIAISHMAHAAGHRVARLGNPAFTDLPRFLAPDGVLGFATIQKVCAAQFAKIRHLSAPASIDSFALAGEIEDKGTNAPYVVQRLREMLDVLRNILAIELMHAAQGQNFRLQAGKTLGKGTSAAYAKVREIVPFLDKDRVLTDDVVALHALLASGGLL